MLSPVPTTRNLVSVPQFGILMQPTPSRSDGKFSQGVFSLTPGQRQHLGVCFPGTKKVELVESGVQQAFFTTATCKSCMISSEGEPWKCHSPREGFPRLLPAKLFRAASAGNAEVV